MDMQLYLHHYREFNDEFFPSASLDDVEAKMREELDELDFEIVAQISLENKIAETVDVLNMSIKLLDRYGVKDPLHAGYLKLQETAQKYRGQHGAE